MRVIRVRDEQGGEFQPVDGQGEPLPLVASFARGLRARGCSPNTVVAYLHDLRRFYDFLEGAGLEVERFTPAHTLDLLGFLNQILSRPHRPRSFPAPVRAGLAPSTINRILAAVSTFYDHLALTGAAGIARNPLEVNPGGGRPGMARTPARRSMRLRRIQRIPRPLSDDQVTRWLEVMDRPRDRAMFLLMLQGGLRPGEVLNLHLDDIEYGKRRVAIRYRTDHPKDARTKSRSERFVDLYEPEALAAVSTYVMIERPADAPTRHLFLVCGGGPRAAEPIGYPALAKLFERRRSAAGLDEPWITPPAAYPCHPALGRRDARTRLAKAPRPRLLRVHPRLHAGERCPDAGGLSARPGRARPAEGAWEGRLTLSGLVRVRPAMLWRPTLRTCAVPTSGTGRHG